MVKSVSNADNEIDGAVVVGGSAAGSAQCVSVASGSVRLESLPEVRELTEKMQDDAKETAKSTKSVRVIRKTGTPDSQNSKKRKKFKKRLPVKRIVTMSLLVIVMGLLALVVYETYKLNDIVDSIHYVPGGVSFDKVEVLVSQSEMNRFESQTDEITNILLCGCDIDKNGTSRTDSMIILTVDHKHQAIKMTSLMRDMYLQIPGCGKNKLNAAFAFGGGNLLLKTIYSNFGIRIDRFVCIDYNVFATVVDNLGGVEVEIEPMELEQFNKYVKGKRNRLSKAGVYNFNGQQALSYCRIRKVGTDTARTARQRRVLTQIMKKARTISPVDAQNLLAVSAPFITSNMTRNEMTGLLLDGLGCLNYDTLELRIPMDGAWTDKKIKGIWYVNADINANARYLNQFIYGENDVAQSLSLRQKKSDDLKSKHDRAAFEKKSRK